MSKRFWAMKDRYAHMRAVKAELRASPERKRAVKEAQTLVNMLAATATCARCKRQSIKRVGEAEARRPIGFYDPVTLHDAVGALVRRGASLEVIKYEAQRALAVCAPCIKKLKHERPRLR